MIHSGPFQLRTFYDSNPIRFLMEKNKDSVVDFILILMGSLCKSTFCATRVQVPVKEVPLNTKVN